MRKTDDGWHRLLKEEADDHLFDGLRFDSRLKDQVAQRLQSEQPAVKRTASTDNKRTGSARLRWLAGGAAALIAGIVVVSIYLQGDFGALPAPGTNKAPSNIAKIQPVPMMGTNGKKGQADDTWTLPDMKTARAWFGDRFEEPAYTPEHAVLDALHAFGPRQGSATQIVMSYTLGQASYQIMQVKTDTFMKIHNSEIVDIHGIDGYLRTEKNPVTSDLQWYDRGIHYTVIGMISREEAVRIARSLQ